MRLTSLDGVRGIAAFVVVLHHCAQKTAPQVWSGVPAHAPFAWIATSPLHVLLSGTFAVFVFFVLSGFVMSNAVSRSRDALPLLFLTRYLRLTVPMVASVVLAWLWTAVVPAAEHDGRANPGLLVALREALYGAYRGDDLWFNSVMWTMRIELIGSYGIYVAQRLIPSRWRPWLLFALLVYFLGFASPPPARPHAWTQALGSVAAGGLLHEAWTRGRLRDGPWGPGLVLSGLYLGGLSAYPLGSACYGGIFAAFAAWSDPQYSVLTFAAALLVAGVLTWPPARAMLESRVPAALGRVSFALYLVHFPPLVIVLPAIVGGAGGTAVVGFLAGYAVLVAALAWALTRWIDEPTMALLRRLRRRASPAAATSRAAA
jgi:peptidoglycan/LPS O-acetylase OafA/YrhL